MRLFKIYTLEPLEYVLRDMHKNAYEKSVVNKRKYYNSYYQDINTRKGADS